jgi:hypothetical protein
MLVEKFQNLLINVSGVFPREKSLSRSNSSLALDRVEMH